MQADTKQARKLLRKAFSGCMGVTVVQMTTQRTGIWDEDKKRNIFCMLTANTDGELRAAFTKTKELFASNGFDNKLTMPTVKISNGVVSAYMHCKTMLDEAFIANELAHIEAAAKQSDEMKKKKL